MKFISDGRPLFEEKNRIIKKRILALADRCDNYGVKLVLSGAHNVALGNEKGVCSGFFTDFPAPELRITLKRCNADLVSLIIHEESHMDQWLDPNSVWYNRSIMGSHNRFFSWLEGNCHYNVPKLASCVQAIEWDCEKRAIKKLTPTLQRYITIPRYIQGSNAYLYYYRHAVNTRKWLNRKYAIVYNLVRDMCPTKLYDLSKYETIPPKIKLAFESFFP